MGEGTLDREWSSRLVRGAGIGPSGGGMAGREKRRRGEEEKRRRGEEEKGRRRSEEGREGIGRGEGGRQEECDPENLRK